MISSWDPNVEFSTFFLTGSLTGGHYGKKYHADVLDYDPDANKWTKVGQLAKARYYHGMSLVPKETADYCV